MTKHSIRRYFYSNWLCVTWQDHVCGVAGWWYKNSSGKWIKGNPVNIPTEVRAIMKEKLDLKWLPMK